MDGNAGLVAAMRAMAEQPDDGAWRAMFDELAASTLSVPVREADGAPTGEVLMAVDADGNGFVPAFTDEEALGRWAGTSVPYARMSAPEIAQMVLGGDASGVALNPADAFGGRLGRRDLEILADGLTRAGAPDERGGGLVNAPAGTNLRVANTPPDIPESTVAELTDVLSDLRGVRALWLFTAATGDDEDHLFVGVEMGPQAPGDLHEMMRTLAGALGPALPEGVHADMLPLDAELLEIVRHAGVEISGPAGGR